MLGGGTGWGVLGTVLSQALGWPQGLCLTSLLSWGERDAGRQRPLFCPANSCVPLPHCYHQPDWGLRPNPGCVPHWKDCGLSRSLRRMPRAAVPPAGHPALLFPGGSSAT